MRKIALVGQHFGNFPAHTTLSPTDIVVDAGDQALASPDIKTVSATVVLSAVESNTAVISVDNSFSNILIARVYVNDEASAVFSDDVTLTFYTNSNFKSKDATFRATGKLVRTYLSSDVSVGDAIVSVDDESDFVQHDLIRIFGTTPGWNRVLSTAAGSLTLEDLAEETHLTDDAVCKALELGGFSLFDDSLMSQLYVKVSFSSAQTVTVKLDITYTIS